MILFPNAKINIGLDILRRRADGFHDIETVFYPLQLSDILEINFSPEFSFTQTGISITGAPDSNLVVKAYKLLARNFAVGPVHIHLHKIIPFGAGLGGGSSDAAFTLVALNGMFNLNLNQIELRNFASEIGSDCPFFITNQAAFAAGRGEVISETPVALKGKHLLLVKPEQNVPTALAYSLVKPFVPSQTLKDRLGEPVESWRKNVQNNFEKSVFSAYPEIESIKAKLYAIGAGYASMSGSGSSVFGIFDEAPKTLPEDFNAYFVWQEVLH